MNSWHSCAALAQDAKETVLSFDPVAWHRCFLVADLLAECYDKSYLEYALIGLANREEPLRVVETLLLVDQLVTDVSVNQSGHSVLRMRAVIDELSQRQERDLIPIVFIHRHPADCQMSEIDDEFFRTALVDQLSTLVAFTDDDTSYRCECRGAARPTPVWEQVKPEPIEYGLAFGLIVNREREHRIYAIRKDWCGRCGSSSVRYVPAKIDLRPERALRAHEQQSARTDLAGEIRKKIRHAPNIFEARGEET